MRAKENGTSYQEAFYDENPAPFRLCTNISNAAETSGKETAEGTTKRSSRIEQTQA